MSTFPPADEQPTDIRYDEKLSDSVDEGVFDPEAGVNMKRVLRKV